MKKGTYEDQIRIEELEVYAHHGVYPEENEKGQHFYVNATLYTNTRPAGLADDLSLSTNYGEVCQFITEFMQQHTFQLIETVAERTAYEVLQQFPLVQGLDLEIRKPEAPIPLPFGSVSVAIHREWHEAYIAVGSNMGDSREHIARALGQLKNSKNIRVEKVSELLETLPYGGVEQENFVNGMFEIRTLLTPEELEAINIMRKALNGLKPDEATDRILDMFSHTRNNVEFVEYGERRTGLSREWQEKGRNYLEIC